MQNCNLRCRTSPGVGTGAISGSIESGRH